MTKKTSDKEATGYTFNPSLEETRKKAQNGLEEFDERYPYAEL